MKVCKKCKPLQSFCSNHGNEATKITEFNLFQNKIKKTSELLRAYYLIKKEFDYVIEQARINEIAKLAKRIEDYKDVFTENILIIVEMQPQNSEERIKEQIENFILLVKSTK